MTDKKLTELTKQLGLSSKVTFEDKHQLYKISLIEDSTYRSKCLDYPKGTSPDALLTLVSDITYNSNLIDAITKGIT